MRRFSVIPLITIASMTAAARGDCAPQSQIKLLPAPPSANDWFGFSVDIDGPRAVVAARFDDDGASNAGTAYIFANVGGVWMQEDKITAADPANLDDFGFSVAISGDTVVIGAPGDDDAGNASGSAYVFVRNGTDWTQQAKLTGSGSDGNDEFGRSVAISGETIAVGAWQDDAVFPSGGAVYVFVRSGTTWTQQQRITTNEAIAGVRLGVAVAISGETILAGANFDFPIASNCGSAYVFVRSGAVWSQQARLIAADAAADDFLGEFLALDGDTAIVTAHGDDDGGASSGSSYVFVRNGTTWTQQQKLTASDAAVGDGFGVAPAISGNIALIGAYVDDTPGPGINSGSAYVFVRNGTTWTEKTKFRAPDGGANEQFGWTIALNGQTAIIGSPFDTQVGASSGSAYIYSLNLRTCDIDADGDVDPADRQIFLEVLLGLDTTPAHAEAADLNCSGAVNGADIPLFLACYL